MIFFFLNEKKTPMRCCFLEAGMKSLRDSFLPHWLRNAPAFASERGQWLQQM